MFITNNIFSNETLLFLKSESSNLDFSSNSFIQFSINVSRSMVPFKSAVWSIAAETEWDQASS